MPDTLSEHELGAASRLLARLRDARPVELSIYRTENGPWGIELLAGDEWRCAYDVDLCAVLTKALDALDHT